MTKGRNHIRDLPHLDPEQEIEMHLRNIANEIENGEFISARYKLERLHQLLLMISNEAEKKNLKEKYQQLNNDLNLKIIRYLSENKNKNDL